VRLPSERSRTQAIEKIPLTPSFFFFLIEDEEPEPGEGWEGGARPEEYDGLFDGP